MAHQRCWKCEFSPSLI